MEINLNKNLQKMQDTYFMGLNFRQTIFGGLGLVLGGGTYFLLTKKGVDDSTATNFVALIVAPFALMGFVNYHGLPFEKLLFVLIRHFFLCPKQLIYRHENSFYDEDKAKIKKAQKMEVRKRD